MRRIIFLVALACLAACRSDMQDQPKYKPLRPSAFFPDGRSSRPVVPGTIARGMPPAESPKVTGKSGSTYVANPLPRTTAVLARGRQRYDIYCAPCHDRVGTGSGMIVERGFKAPPTFHQDRLRDVADGYIFETITEGFGVMPSYAQQIPIDDRWAIAAWIRVLQRSQNATLDDVPSAERTALERQP
jgi:cytochrome c553